MNWKKMTAVVGAAAMLLCAYGAVPGTAEEMSLTASAATSGTYGTMTYTMYDDYVEITGFDNSVANVTIPSKIEGVAVTRIDDEAFKDATKLESVTIPSGVTEIGAGAFKQCTSLQNVSLPSTLTSIGSNCFENAISMQKIEIPDNTLFIDNSAFAGCVSLLELEFPEGSEKIGNDVANGCTSLHTLIINNGPTQIGARAFRYCTSLETVYIPISIIDLNNETGISGWYGFGDCSVKHVYYAGTSVQWNAVERKGGLSNATIHYGAEDIPPALSPDLNGDGTVNAIDASFILQYAAYAGAGGTDDLATFLSNLL